MRRIKLKTKSNQLYHSKWTEVLEMIEEDEIKNWNGTIKLVEVREDNEPIKEHETINSNGPIRTSADRRISI